MVKRTKKEKAKAKKVKKTKSRFDELLRKFRELSWEERQQRAEALVREVMKREKRR